MKDNPYQSPAEEDRVIKANQKSRLLRWGDVVITMLVFVAFLYLLYLYITPPFNR